MLPKSVLILSLLLGGLAPVAVGRGAPAICHPLEIGKAKSLPWRGDGAFSYDAKYGEKRLVSDTLAILDESDDPFVHVETLRRAVVYLAHTKENRKKTDPRAHTLVMHLQERVLELEAASGEGKPGATEAARGLRWLDLGFLQAALGQSGIRVGDEGEVALRRSASLRSDCGASQLCAALGIWIEDERARNTFLDRAIRLSDDPKAALRRNILSTAAQFYGCATLEELGAKVDRELGKS